MSDLKKNNNISCVIITSCSVAGNAGSGEENFACKISKKINSNGVVVGCRYNVIGGDTYFKPANPNQNATQPWYIYRDGLVIDKGLPSQITMEIVYKYLIQKNYI